MLWSAALLSACSFAPRYHKPSVAPAPPVYQESGEWQTAQPADAVARGRGGVYSRIRSSIRSRAASASPIRIEGGPWHALSRPVRRRASSARQNFRRSPPDHSDALPYLRGNAPNYDPNLPSVHNDWLAEGDLSYEIDLWGRIRNGVRAAAPARRPVAADAATLELGTALRSWPVITSSFAVSMPSRHCSITRSRPTARP